MHFVFDSFVNAAIFHIAKHGSNSNLEETVAGDEHGLVKQQTGRKDVSCDKNAYRQTRLQKACNKLNSDSTSAIVETNIKPKHPGKILEGDKSKIPNYTTIPLL